MSYDPSHRKPPRQERWPSEIPAEGWPSYRDDDEYRGGEQAVRWYEMDRAGAHPASRTRAGYQHAAGGSDDHGYSSPVATDTFPSAGYGYGYGYRAGDYGYADAADGYAGVRNGYDWAASGYGVTADGVTAGPNDLGPGSYTEYNEHVSGDPRLVAPDAGVHPDTWQAEQDGRRQARQRGMVVGAATEVLGTAVVIGVSTLAAGLLKAQTSPAAAMGSVFVDRTPAALRNALAHHFGPHGRTLLLLGMYAAIAFVAIAIGVLGRRAAAVGVAGLAAFTLFAAFIAVTRPASHLGDVTPAAVGGLAGVAALLWLVRASAPITPLRHAHGGTRRRTR